MPHLSAIFSADSPCGVRSYFAVISSVKGTPGPCMIVDMIGTRDIDSTPPPIAMSTTPELIRFEAKWIACWPLPHWRSTDVAGDFVREVGGEDDVAGDVRALLAGLGHVPEDDVADHRRLDAGALDDLVQGLRAEGDGVDAGEYAVAAPHGRPHGLNDDYFSHDLWAPPSSGSTVILADAKGEKEEVGRRKEGARWYNGALWTKNLTGRRG